MNMRKISIGYLILSRSLSGTEKHIIDVTSHLTTEQFEAILFCKEGQFANVASEAGVEVITISKGPLKNPVFFILGIIRLAYYIRLKRIDILHCYLNVFGVFIARLMGVPIVITSRRSINSFSNPVHLLYGRIANKMTNLVIANSVAGRTNAITKERIPPREINVIYNGIQICKYQTKIDIPDKKRQLGVLVDTHIVGTVANLRANLEKGQLEFIQAAEIVIKQIPNTQFLIVGSGPLKPFLDSQINRLSLTDKVSIIGSNLQSEARKDISEILQTLDLFVLCSHREGFSNALLEAMAAGKPIIATAVGGNVEAITNGTTGILVPLKDPESLAEAIIRFLRDPDMAREMGIHARERVEREFRLEYMIKRMEEVYMDLAKSAGII